jgi:toxin ParE1/3/4
VNQVIYSSPAKADLVTIIEYTLRVWGKDQTERYIDELEDRCQKLAQNPMLGRPYNGIPHGLRRIEQGKHIIFYRQLDTKILITRILHQSMLPSLHSLDAT